MSIYCPPQDLTHKLCEALSLAAGCSSDPPPPSPPPTRDLPSEGEEGFEVVEHADLHTAAAPATSQRTVRYTCSCTDKYVTCTLSMYVF